MKALVRNPIAWGILLSAMVLALVVGLARAKDEAGVAAYSRFLALDPNAMGDTLAGIFACLAFIWIVVTVFVQSAELREQREVLKLQRSEFEQMVAAQQAQVGALRAQTEIFLDEQRDRREKRAENMFLAQFGSIKSQMFDIVDLRGFWIFERDGALSGFGVGDHQYKSRLNPLEGREAIESMVGELRKALETLKIVAARNELRSFPGRRMLESFEEKVVDLQQIDDLSEATQVVLSDYRLERVAETLNDLFSISTGLPESPQ